MWPAIQLQYHFAADFKKCKKKLSCSFDDENAHFLWNDPPTYLSIPSFGLVESFLQNRTKTVLSSQTQNHPQLRHLRDQPHFQASSNTGLPKISSIATDPVAQICVIAKLGGHRITNNIGCIATNEISIPHPNKPGFGNRPTKVISWYWPRAPRLTNWVREKSTASIVAQVAWGLKWGTQ